MLKNVRMRTVLLPMCPTDGPMARGARRDIPGNSLGQWLYIPNIPGQHETFASLPHCVPKPLVAKLVDHARAASGLTSAHRAEGLLRNGRRARTPSCRAACRVIYARKPMARGRRGPHSDRTRQSDIKIDVRLPAVIASRPPATLLEALNRARAALKVADKRALVAARSARVLD